MLFNEFDIVNDVIPEQFWKALSPKLVTVLGIVTVFKAAHPMNAELPMYVTEVGIVNDFNPVQPEKTLG